MNTYTKPVLLAETVVEELTSFQEVPDGNVQESEAAVFVVGECGIEAKGSLCR